MQIQEEQVILAQKYIIQKCNLSGKPCFISTQILESMTKNPRPTRAEVSDAANAILDGADGVVLSHETAIGVFASKSVQMISKICNEAEQCLDQVEYFTKITSQLSIFDVYHNNKKTVRKLDKNEAVSAAAVQASFSSICKCIIVITESGYSAYLIAKYHPSVAIIACSHQEKTLFSMSILRGVKPMELPSNIQMQSQSVQYALQKIQQEKLVSFGDQVVVLHDIGLGAEGHTKIMQIITVGKTKILQMKQQATEKK